MEETKQPLIDIVGIKKYYESGDVVTKALDGVDLRIQDGEFVALMGPSGSGKSTLMHIMGFLDRPTEGAYRFNGKDVAKLEDDELALMRRGEAGFVFQFFNLLPNSSVIENVVLPLIYARVPRSKRRAMAEAALKEVGLEERINHMSNQISGGERQRVAVARALVNEPAVIFADEPTGNLDSRSGEMILKLLQDLNMEGHTIVMVTHEVEAAEFAERIVRLRDGKIVSDKKEHNRRTSGFTK